MIIYKSHKIIYGKKFLNIIYVLISLGMSIWYREKIFGGLRWVKPRVIMDPLIKQGWGVTLAMIRVNIFLLKRKETENIPCLFDPCRSR
jgi:hypothetical protein